MANITALQPVTFSGNNIAYQRLFTFRTPDTQAVVEGANYLSKYDVPEAKVADIIRIIGPDYDVYYDVTAAGDYLTIAVEGDTSGGGATTPASYTAAGIVQLSTPADASAGMSDNALTPSTLAALPQSTALANAIVALATGQGGIDITSGIISIDISTLPMA